ncbi:hypothetical protein N0V94_003926 [Neodidymelliopsis sp. IMI 364377]|nr:hypothetical protein N0V94_003926 [Neodidymelliopsis sp. IMI 364377]
MLKYGDPGYMEEDQGPMLYSITFSFLAVAIIMSRQNEHSRPVSPDRLYPNAKKSGRVDQRIRVGIHVVHCILTLACSYGVGILVIACSIIRLRNIVHFNGEGDFTYVASMVPVWGAIECNAGIICASLPFIVPLIKKMSGSAIDSMTGTRLHLKSQNDRDVQLSDIKHGQVDSRHQSETQLVPAKPEEQIRVDYEFGFGVSDAREGSDKQ